MGAEMVIRCAHGNCFVAGPGRRSLLADTIHNFGDAATAIPLGVAFLFARKRPNKRFTFGYGRVEDLAGVTIVFVILFSAIVAGYESIDRFLRGQSDSAGTLGHKS